jgi:predicted  nucleic acid-binding Zn-ribbon protein
LLDLQEVDSTLDSLAVRLRALPEQIELTKLSERRMDVAARHGHLQTETTDLAREQRKADADVEQVKTRRDRNDQRITAGTVSDPRQLQALQHENESLARRISDLEDVELDVMERLEGAQAELDRLGHELADLDERVTEQTKARDEAAADVARRQTDALADRERLTAEIPAALLALYDRLRDQLGGVAVGVLQHGRCGGCRLDIGARELARISTAPDDEVFRCEECDRILVRTAASGV